MKEKQRSLQHTIYSWKETIKDWRWCFIFKVPWLSFCFLVKIDSLGFIQNWFFFVGKEGFNHKCCFSLSRSGIGIYPKTYKENTKSKWILGMTMNPKYINIEKYVNQRYCHGHIWINIYLDLSKLWFSCLLLRVSNSWCCSLQIN